MTLSRKQMDRVINISRMVDHNLERAKIRTQRGFRPDRTIFAKLEKLLTVGAQNACDKSTFDNEPELNELVYKVCQIVTGAWDMREIIRITTQYGLESCQLSILRGILDFANDPRKMIGWNFRDGQLLPSAHSYWIMVRD